MVQWSRHSSLTSEFVDNITHSLAGLLLAGTAVTLRSRKVAGTTDDRQFATVAALTGVVGANLPDIDVLWSAILQAMGVYDDLLSLLHHRGYTHTVLAALCFIPLLWQGAVWMRRRQQRDTVTSAPERTADSSTLLGLAIVAVLSHVTLDFTNDYGVHPLSPFVNAWTYGDSMFIIEPWLWVAAVPMLLRITERRWLRGLLWCLLMLGLALSWAVPQVSLPAAIIVTMGAALWILVSRGVARNTAPFTGIAMWVIVTVLFASGTYAVRSAVRGVHRASSQNEASFGTGRLVDVMTSPSPANPLCARVITVETTRDTYRLTTAWGSALPSLVSASWCSAAVGTDTTRGAQTLPMQRASRPRTAAIDWHWTWQAPRAELVQLARENCRVSAWLRFVRAPFWVRGVAGDSLRVGDLRYDRERVSVAAFTFAERTGDCPQWVPPWTRPRDGASSADGAD